MDEQKYIWQQKAWPHFTWNTNEVRAALARAEAKQTQLHARAAEIGIEVQAQIFSEDALNTSAIEGEKLSLESISSSVAKRLGMPNVGRVAVQKNVEGLVEMLFDATQNYDIKLTKTRLFQWHSGLFPAGQSGYQSIAVGQWRNGDVPMQVISGPIGREKIHFEAPSTGILNEEMKIFFDWFNTNQNLNGLIRAAIAHLHFVTIHPFEDGNGRIARAITDQALAQSEKISVRTYSMSSQINRERESYYQILEATQKGDLNITPWVIWFLEVFESALNHSLLIIERTLYIGQFWQRNALTDLNIRQKKVLQKLLEAEPSGFNGGMTNKKYVSITKTSRESAKRDLADLEQKALIMKNEGKGRSVSYALSVPLKKPK